MKSNAGRGCLKNNGESNLNPIHTLGHSNHTKSELMDLLRRNRIQTVVDVRSTPYSCYVRRFNRDELQGCLTSRGIQYRFMGDILGGRPTEKGLYTKQGRANYRAIARTPGFQRGLEEIVRAAESERVCLICTEKDPTQCHRTLLVAHDLHSRGLDLLHIDPDRERAVAHTELLVKLMKKRGTTDPEEAINRQAEKVAYRKKI